MGRPACLTARPDLVPSATHRLRDPRRASLAAVARYLTEADVEALLPPADAVDAVERCFERMARGAVENRPRYRLGLERGKLAVMAAADLELGYAGVKAYAAF